MFGVKKKTITNDSSSYFNHSHSKVTFEQKFPFTFNFKFKVDRRLWVGLGGVSLITLGGGLIYGWLFIEQKLAPLIEQELTDFLNRPLKIGAVEGISLTGVRFGKSEILPTLKDPAKISLEAVEVSFNPLKFFTQSQLALEVKAIRPNIYLEQGINGSWLITPFDVIKSSGSKDLSIDLTTLQFIDADVTLTARASHKNLKSPVKLSFPSFKLDFANKGRLIDFKGLGKFAQGGRVKLSGSAKTNKGEINLAVLGEQVKATDVKNLIALPINLKDGEVGGNLTVKLRPKQLPLIKGIATLNQVTAQIPQLPQAFTNSQGILRFNETDIKLEGVTSQFGKIAGVVNGTVDFSKGYSLTAKTQPFQVQDAIQTLKLTAPSVPIVAELKSDIQVTGKLNKPQVSLSLVSQKNALIDKVNFQSLKANLEFNNSQIDITHFQALPTVGGELIGKGKLLGNHRGIVPTFVVDAKATNIPSQEIAGLYQTRIPPSVGLVSGQLSLAGQLQNINSWKGTGTASFPYGKGTINVNQIEYNAGNWKGQLQASGIDLRTIGINLPQTISHGRVNAQLNLSGDRNSFTPNTIVATGTANLSVADGSVTANNLHLAQGQWKTDLQVQGVKVNQFVSNLPDQFKGHLAGNFSLKGDLQSTLSGIQGIGEGTLILPSGTIKGTKLELNQGAWKGNLQTDNLQIASLIPNVPTGLHGKLQGSFNLAGNLDSSLKEVQGKGQGRLIVSSGTITAQSILIEKGKFKTLLTPEQVQLASFSPQLKGTLGGKLNIMGDLNKVTPATVQAQGDLKFSQGLSLINRPLTTTIHWTGQRLEILQATAKDFQGKGFVDLNLSNKQDNSIINQFEFNVNAVGLGLKDLIASFPNQKIKYEGGIDFKGKIAGTPEKPNINGELAVTNLQFANLAVDPILKGSINVVPESGVNLQLAGNTDNIKLSLDENYQPVSFDLNLDQMTVEGTYQNQQLLATADNIPLQVLTELAVATDVPISKSLLSQRIEGELSGNFVLDINHQNFNGKNVAIANPRWGHIYGDRFSGDISLNNGELTLQNGQFQRNKSLYDVNATVTPSPEGPRLHTEIGVTGGKIEDVLETLQIFEVSDFRRGLQPPTYVKAKDLQTSQNQEDLYSVGLPKASLGNQLQYFAQINNQLQKAEQERQKVSPLPELEDLKGQFDGKLSVNASVKTGIEAKFDVKGQAWQWGNLHFPQLQAKGDLKDGLLNLEPVSVALNNSLLTFSGQISDRIQSGKLQLQKLPLNLVKQFVTIPAGMDVEGLVNAEINLAGKRDNPQIKGQVAIADASINQIPIQATQGEFNYSDSRLTFQAGSHPVLNSQVKASKKNSSNQLTTQNPPIKIEGSLPYQLPFSKVTPSSDDLKLNIRVQNEGLALLNVLTRGQLSWQGGQGEINLDVAGQFDQQKGRPTHLQADGLAKLENATIAAQILPDDPITKLNGKIAFNFDQIKVENLKGNFSGGQVTVAGTLPLLMPIPVKDPLTVNAEKLNLNFKGLYQGEIEGNVQVAGSVLTPKVGGKLNLVNGQILLGESGGETVNNSTSQKSMASLTTFNNLQVNLGDNVWITRPPVLRILAAGNLNINGTLAEPRPEGDIKLKAGQVNLFSAQFGLVGGEVNTARFTPNRGLDPHLDIQMIASVSETTRNAVRTNPQSSEINDHSAFPSDSLQTIRVEAKIDGYASQLTNHLELTSLPPRSQSEIIALLGGNFINPVMEKDPRLGLANLAGSAVFGTIQGPISKVLGLSDFRVYPTQLLNEKDRVANYQSQIGIAAEASVDLRDDLSLSVQKIVNTDRPANFGVRYRINNNTVIRGTSNFSDDNRGMVEYQRRF